MFAIEKRVGGPKNGKWEFVSEWSTRDLAQNIARMQFGKNNPVVRVVDKDAVVGLNEKRR